MTTQAMVPTDLRDFIDEHADDYYAMKLILFFANFPRARFSGPAISGALGLKSTHQGLKQALNNLVGKRVTEVCSDAAVPVYKLADDTSIRSRVVEIGRLDFDQKQELLRRARS